MKKTSMPNPAKNFEFIKCHSSTNPRPITSNLATLSDTTVKRPAADHEDLKSYRKSEKKKTPFPVVINDQLLSWCDYSHVFRRFY